jgi:hypothetical protein
MVAGSATYSAAVFGVSAWTMWVMARNVAQMITRATAIRAPLDDRIGFNIDDLMMAESMLPEEQERMLDYDLPFPEQLKQSAG